MSEMSCARLQEISAELALGIADAHARADALAHLDHCASCRREVRGLGETVEILAGLAPAVEPPAGFESRVLAALSSRTRDEPATGSGGGSLSGLPRLLAGRASRSVSGGVPGGVTGEVTRRRAALAAAAVFAAAAGSAGWLIGSAVSHAPPAATARLRAVALRSGPTDVGEVVMSKGASPWMSVAVRTGLGDAWVRCELREANGRVVSVGTFQLEHGYGYWAAPLPNSWSSATSARLVTSGGQVVASASISPQAT
jgi:hypothetical protein